MSRLLPKSSPSWTEVKNALATVDRAGLFCSVRDRYAVSTDSQAFIHARLNLGEDLLKHYKKAIDRWLWPDVFTSQRTSVADAKKSIADYKKAAGTADGLAELMVFYCEQASGFSRDVGSDGGAYLSALVRMYGQVLKTVATPPETERPAFWARLQMVRDGSHDFGYGVGDEMDALLTEHWIHA